MIRRVALAFVLLAPLLGLAQQSELGNWLIFFGNKKLTPKWDIHAEGQLRNYNAIGDLEQLLLRTGVGYNLTEKNNNAMLGYAYVLSQNYMPGDPSKKGIHEHRIFQQFITRHNVGRVAVQHRYRFEQRWIDVFFRLRLRYFLALQVPLNHKEMQDKTVFLSAYNEIFLNLQGNPFDRNRLYAGVGFKANSKLRFELGYMNQFLPTQNRDQINVIVFLNL